jgi:hypothetical protein
MRFQCPHCSSSRAQRLRSHGFWIKVAGFFGLTFWECGRCAHQFAAFGNGRRGSHAPQE